MSTNSVLTRIGIIADEMTPPRGMARYVRPFFSVVAVCYAYFFIHISFFGPPVEEVFRGTPPDARRHFGEHPARGEVTVVLDGRPRGTRSADAATAQALAGEALDAGLAPTAAAREVARRSGMPRGAAYAVVMGVRAGRGGGGGGGGAE